MTGTEPIIICFRGRYYIHSTTGRVLLLDSLLFIVILIKLETDVNKTKTAIDVDVCYTCCFRLISLHRSRARFFYGYKNQMNNRATRVNIIISVNASKF